MRHFVINQDPDTLHDYYEELKAQLTLIETLSLELEREPEEMDQVMALRGIFQQLLFSSTKLELIPIGENLEIMLKAFDFMLECRVYPPEFTEVLLLFIDQLLQVNEQVLEEGTIDLFAVQNIHIALQDIHLAQTIGALREGAGKAISILNGSKRPQEHTEEEDDAIMLFDDFDELDGDIMLFSADEGEVIGTGTPDAAYPELFIPEASLNPINQAREFMAVMSRDPVSLLAEMSDQLTSHGERHSMYLQEIALAINTLMGEPVSAEDLWYGLALHDIGLADMLGKQETSNLSTKEVYHRYKKHPTRGVELGKRIGLSEGALRVIEQHHEWINGLGYPHGLANGQISEEGRIAALVDAFHSTIHQRPYRSRSQGGLLQTVEDIKRGAGSQFDPRVVDAFITCMREYWVPRHVVRADDAMRVVDFEL